MVKERANAKTAFDKDSAVDSGLCEKWDTEEKTSQCHLPGVQGRLFCMCVGADARPPACQAGVPPPPARGVGGASVAADYVNAPC